MANKWFSSVFLPSVFESCGTGRSRWLTKRQSAVCVEHMELERIPVPIDGVGDRTGFHHNYAYEWRGRRVVLSYSKKNGCGFITFGADEAEQEEARVRAMQERARIEAERVEHIKRRPWRLEWWAARLEEELRGLRGMYDLAQEDEDEEAMEHWAQKIAEVQKKMEQLGIGEA